MTQLQDVRKFIQKGDRAVQLLESLGYTYVSDNKSEPRWVAPVEQDPKVALAKFLREQAEGLDPTLFKTPDYETSAFPPVPKGRYFTINPARIPSWHKLSKYHSSHFDPRIKFTVAEVFKPKTASYPTGWAVEFDFEVSMGRHERVWLPLSACNFG